MSKNSLSKKYLVQKFNHTVSVVLFLIGVTFIVLTLFRIIMIGHLTPTEAQPFEITFLFLSGFYHILFAGLCYGVFTALTSEQGYPHWLKRALYSLAGSSIFIGVIDMAFILICNKTSVPIIEPLAKHLVIHKIPIGIYSIGFGILCISISTMIEKKFELNWINLIGSFIFLMTGFFQFGFFLENGHKLFPAFLVGFYHFIFISLTLGISETINPEKLEIIWLKNNMNFFGYTALGLSVLELFLILYNPSLLEPFSPYSFIVAIIVVLYSLILGGLCLGLSNILEEQIQGNK